MSKDNDDSKIEILELLVATSFSILVTSTFVAGSIWFIKTSVLMLKELF